MLLNDQCIVEEIRKEIKKLLELMKTKTVLWDTKLCFVRHSKGSPNGKVYSHECIY
jgi:hypothetical protein